MTEPKTTSSGPGAVERLQAPEQATLEELLCDVSLHSARRIASLFSQPQFGNLDLPSDIRVHCDHQKCGGVRRHSALDSKRFENGENFYVLVTYQCTNCSSAIKVFGLKAERQGMRNEGRCTKIYQEPPFGQPIPKRLFEVIGEGNREPFLQARRAIARGLGIGAYAYYRRIVENTKFALVDSVLNVAQATNASSEQIELLKKAQSERQFSKAIELLRDVAAIPAVLLIDGHNRSHCCMIF